jgi:hypothetical protein
MTAVACQVLEQAHELVGVRQAERTQPSALTVSVFAELEPRALAITDQDQLRAAGQPESFFHALHLPNLWRFDRLPAAVVRAARRLRRHRAKHAIGRNHGGTWVAEARHDERKHMNRLAWGA